MFWAVWKFPLALTGGVINMPRGSTIIKTAMQYGTLTLWAVVDPNAAKKDRVFAVYGTGHDIPDLELLAHIGTVLDGAFVWHVFERHA